MDKTARAVKIIRRMTEIEELLANKDLLMQDAENLRYEYEKLDVELENLDVAT